MFEKAFGPMSPQLKREFAKHFSLDDPELEERYRNRNKRMERQYNVQALANRINLMWSKSLWGSSPIDFTFDDWKPEERKNVEMAKHLGNKAYLLSREMVNGHLNVVLSGDAGVGKTSLALAMLSKLRQSGVTTLFVSVVALDQLLSDQYKFGDCEERLGRLREAMAKVDVLLLDDLGAEAGDVRKVMSSDYTGTRKDMQKLIFEVANERYEGTKAERNAARKQGRKLIKPVHQTIVTTNNITDELKRIYGERTTSRLITQMPEHRLPFNDMEDMRQVNGF